MRPLVLAALLVAPMHAQAETGAQAFDAQDYARAETLSRQDAAHGAIDAMMRLGTMADYGLGGTVDRDAAFGWYMEAARRGSAAAQLNVAVMLDAGIGAGAAPDRALIWYSRAALRGNARAAYNLGLLYEAGAGTPKNDGLARYWFSQAGITLTAAAEKLATLAVPVAEGALRAPDPAFAELGAGSAELVWRVAPDASAGPFVVQVALLEDAAPKVVAARTRASALFVPLDGRAVPLFWRVAGVNDAEGRYAASAWQGLPPGTVGVPGFVTLGPGVAGSASGAAMADGLRSGGIWVAPTEGRGLPDVPPRVVYGYAQDADFAGVVARLLPGGRARQAILDPDAGLQPGEVRIGTAAPTSD